MLDSPINLKIKQINFDDITVILDIPTTNTFVVDFLTVEIINLITDFSGQKIISKLKNKYSKEKIIKKLDYVEELYNNGRLTSVDKSEETEFELSTPQYTLILHPSRHCNLDCKYCFGSEEHISREEISLSTAKDAIDFLVNDFGTDGKKYTVDLAGSGEPLLRFDFIKEIYNYCNQVSEEIGKEIVVTFATNGTLLDEEKIDYLSSTDILYGISLDGGEKINDDLRVYENGIGTYDDVINNCEKIENREHLGFATTITGEHASSIKETFLELFDLDLANAISMKPVRGKENSEYSINESNIEELKKGYSELTSFLLDKTLEGELDYIKTLLAGEDYFGKFIDRVICASTIVKRCNAGLSRLSVNHAGDLYMCQVKIDDEDFKIGNIYEGINEEKHDWITNLLVDDIEKCQDCWAKYICGGECFAVGKQIHDQFEKPYKVMCQYRKHLIKLAIYLVNKIKEGKPEIYKELYASCMRDKVYNVSDPGAFCLTEIAEYYNLEEVSIRNIREIGEADETGINPSDLLKTAKKIGLQAKAAKATKESLINEASVPLIAHINEGYGNVINYYVVVKQLEKDKVKFIDPIQGEMSCSLEEFCNLWSGILYLFEGVATKELKSQAASV